MLLSIRPAEHIFSLILNLAVIAIAAFSLAKLLPQSIQLKAKQSLMSQQLEKVSEQVSALEDSVQQDRLHPRLNARKNANLTKTDHISIFWHKSQEK